MTTSSGALEPSEVSGRAVSTAEVSRLLQDLTNLLQPLTGYAEMVASGILAPDKLPEALRAIKESSSALLERIHEARVELLAPPSGSVVVGRTSAASLEEERA